MRRRPSRLYRCVLRLAFVWIGLKLCLIVQAEAFFANSLDCWRRAIDVDSMILVAHSLGGYLGTCYALSHPKHVSKLILLGPAGMTITKDASSDFLHSQPASEMLLSPLSPTFASASPPSFATQLESEPRDEPIVTHPTRSPEDTGLLYSFFHFLWRFNITPLHVARYLGPIKPLAAHKFYQDRLAKYTAPDAAEAMFSYIYGLNLLSPISSGNALQHLLGPGGVPYFPLIDRLETLRCPIHVVYGSEDWIPRLTETDLRRQHLAGSITIINGPGAFT